MASNFLSLLFSLLLFVIFANGRSLQKNYTSENADLLHDFSLATNSYTGKTNYDDVLGLVALCTQFTWLLEDNEDPCISPKWSWIECNSDPKPRIIALDLNSKLLIGLLPDFSSMDALQRIDLSQNSIYGIIPSFLGTFPDLQELNLANNLLYGLVPESLACNKKLKLSLTGNTGLYTSDKCSTSTSKTSPASSSNSDSSFVIPETRSRKKKNNIAAIVGSTISVFGVFWIAVGIYAIYRHKAKTAAAIAQAASTPPEAIDPRAHTPTEEMPINNAHPNNMTPNILSSPHFTNLFTSVY